MDDIEEIVVKKKFNNKWLEDKEFLDTVKFDDIFYFKQLAHHLSNYLKIVPIPVLTMLDKKHKSISFMVGDNKKRFEMDVNISYRDYITLVHRWIKPFFPCYVVEYEKEEELTESEILARVKDNPELKLNDLLQVKEKKIKTEKGMIIKIHITTDEFVLQVDDKEFIRISGTIENPMSLSGFLRNLRKIKDDREKRDFIFANSEEIKMISQNNDKIIVDYEGDRMMNFFIIQYPDLKDVQVVHNTNGSYTWGNYQIVFQSFSVEQDCIRYLKDRLRRDGVVGNKFQDF